MEQLVEFDPKKQKALTALLEQLTIDKAADAAGVDRSTIYRYLKDPDFAAAYR